MAYRKLSGAAFTGQDVEREEPENLVAITRGEFAKADREGSLLSPLVPLQCRATPNGNDYCIFVFPHDGRCSWDR